MREQNEVVSQLNLRVDPEIRQELKILAARRGMRMKEIAQQLLREAMRQEKTKAEPVNA